LANEYIEHSNLDLGPLMVADATMQGMDRIIASLRVTSRKIMNKPTNGSPLSPCQGCGKTHTEVLRMVALTGNVNICNECVDLAAEIVHEEGDVRIALSDLEALRAQAREAGYFRHWLDMVRDAVDRADARLKEFSAEPAGSAADGAQPSQAPSQHPDTILLDFIGSEYLDVSAFAMPTGAGDADVGWKLVQEHEGKKGRVEVACHYRDDLRAAIREAMQKLGYTLPADGVQEVPRG
jgi:hypothetical protein